MTFNIEDNAGYAVFELEAGDYFNPDATVSIYNVELGHIGVLSCLFFLAFL